MTYTKAGWNPVLTELNYVPDKTIEDYNWLTKSDPELHIKTQFHQSWCEDPACGRFHEEY